MKHDQNRYKWSSQFKRHVRETVYSWSLGRQKIVVNLNPAESALDVRTVFITQPGFLYSLLNWLPPLTSIHLQKNFGSYGVFMHPSAVLGAWQVPMASPGLSIMTSTALLKLSPDHGRPFKFPSTCSCSNKPRWWGHAQCEILLN